MDPTIGNLWALLAVFGLYLIQSAHPYYQGRHVCTERRKVQRPVSYTQSYRKAIYRKDLGRVVYVTAHKTAFKLEMKTHLYHTCCKGWKKRVTREQGCLTPVCREKCLNGGHCIAPDLCMCSEGYAGYKCQTDINECSGRHQCQQKCINVPGTYHCACQNGFVLSEDEISCDLCLSCTPEFKSMQEQMAKMGKQIVDMEQEKQSLQKNLTIALEQYQEAFQRVEKMEERNAQSLVTSRPVTTKHTTETDYVMSDEKDKLMPLDRLASLSQQISILEERMADCACNDDYYRG